jgi:glycosyltransferase involved in cell wall biosynthesis
MKTQKINIFFPNFVDPDNFNAQSLNIREIVRRLPSDVFNCTIFYARRPDTRLTGLTHVKLIKLPSRLGSLVMLCESLRRYHFIFNPSVSQRFTDIYFSLPKSIRKPTKTVSWIEFDPRGTQEIDPDTIKKFYRFKGNVDVFVAISDYVATTSRKYLGINSHAIIPVGVDKEIFRQAARKERKSVEVLFIGHLIEGKRPSLVLEAARSFPKAHFTLIGSDRDRGNYLQKLTRQAEQYRLTNVEFLNPVPQPMLAKLMARSDIFLHPSLVEGVPKVTLEAAATGLPCIVFDRYQTPSVIDGVTGFQVKSFEEMVERLRILIENPELRRRMGAAAIEHVRQFDWAVIAKRWERIFREIFDCS